jgi:ArsR family transcriptional regulator
VDLALLSQALHHSERPAAAVEAAYRILKPGGRVIILDLLQHQFEEARELYADRWLGFSEAELHGWLEDAGFQDVEVSIVAREPNTPHFQTVMATAIKPET